MTREEFDYKHEEIIKWYQMWQRLFYIFVVFFIITLIANNLMASTIVIGSQCLFVIFEFICRRNHNKLHEKWEQQHSE